MRWAKACFLVLLVGAARAQVRDACCVRDVSARCAGESDNRPTIRVSRAPAPSSCREVGQCLRMLYFHLAV